MGLAQTNQVDYIGIDRRSGNVVLSLLDELDWLDEGNHLQLLQDKLNTYLAYIESEQVYEGTSEWRDKQIDIYVYARCQYTHEGAKFLELASQVISEAGYGFMWVHVPDEEDDEH